jgi:hypothetical protein
LTQKPTTALPNLPDPRADAGVIPGDSTSRCIRTVPISDATITLVRMVAELEQWFPLTDLEPETLALAA